MSGLLGCFGVCLVCGLFGFLRGVHCELLYGFYSLLPFIIRSVLIDDCISFEVFLPVEFDLKGAFALSCVVFVSYKLSVFVVLWFYVVFCLLFMRFSLHYLCLSLDPPIFFLVFHKACFSLVF